MSIQVEGYLTQAKLANVFKQAEQIELLGEEVRLPDSRKRWDALIQIGDTKMVVEFDGSNHYTDPARILVDEEKDAVAKSIGYVPIRIPYWVQLTNVTSQYYFGVALDIDQDFPHGFIDPKALTPAYYCSLGVQRYYREIAALPAEVQEQIIKSLNCKALNPKLLFPV